MPDAATLERSTEAVELLAVGMSYDEIALEGDLRAVAQVRRVVDSRVGCWG